MREARLLGVRRSGVSEWPPIPFKRAALFDLSRGHVVILDREGLAAARTNATGSSKKAESGVLVIWFVQSQISKKRKLRQIRLHQ